MTRKVLPESSLHLLVVRFPSPPTNLNQELLSGPFVSLLKKNFFLTFDSVLFPPSPQLLELFISTGRSSLLPHLISLIQRIVPLLSLKKGTTFVILSSFKRSTFSSQRSS